MSSVHVGNPPSEWYAWESYSLHFHQFESLPSQEHSCVTSPPFNCFNNEWRVKIYPGGCAQAKQGMVSIYLLHCCEHEISVAFGFLLKDKKGEIVSDKSGDFNADAKDDEGNSCLGWPNFVRRSAIVGQSSNVLQHGSLTIVVNIRAVEDDHCNNFIPKNPFMQNMLRLFSDERTSDVVFEVQAQANSEQQSVLFHAHTVVLKICAEGSIFDSLCDDYDESSPILISDIDPQLFRPMLYYVYGGRICASVWKDHAKDLIDVADKYGLKHLKIEAEAWYVEHLKIAVDNVIETLVYAEKKNCFLLKEVAIDYIVTNAESVLASDSFKNIPESKSITRDILLAVAKKETTGGKRDPTKLISINDLRARLCAGGKEFDGSRELLIARLE